MNAGITMEGDGVPKPAFNAAVSSSYPTNTAYRLGGCCFREGCRFGLCFT